MSSATSPPASSSSSTARCSNAARVLVETVVIVLVVFVILLSLSPRGFPLSSSHSLGRSSSSSAELSGSDKLRPAVLALTPNEAADAARTNGKSGHKPVSSAAPAPQQETPPSVAAARIVVPAARSSSKPKPAFSSPSSSSTSCTPLWNDEFNTAPLFDRSDSKQQLEIVLDEARRSKNKTLLAPLLHFHGSPVSIAPLLPVAAPSSPHLASLYMCEQFGDGDQNRVPIIVGGTNTSGCVHRQVNSLLATRFFNVYDRRKVERVLKRQATSDAREKARACFVQERLRINETMDVLIGKKKTCLLQSFAELAAEFRKNNNNNIDDLVVHGDVVKRKKKEGVAFSDRRRLLVVGIGKMPLDKSVVKKMHKKKAAAAASAIPSERKESDVPHQQQEQLYRTKPPEEFRFMFQTFLAVANPHVDEMHLVLDYSVKEFESFCAGLRAQEDRVRRHRFAQTGNRSSRSSSNAIIEKASDGLAAAKIVIWDVNVWLRHSSKSLVVSPSESGTTTRVYYINHLLNDVMTSEHDETISMLLFSDARDVLFQTNPFDAIEELDIPRSFSTSSFSSSTTTTKNGNNPSSSFSSSPYDSFEEHRQKQRLQLQNRKIVFVAAEEQSHYCNHLIGGHKRGGTPLWERNILSKEGVKRSMTHKGRRLPDNSLLPILNSGFYGALSLQAAKDFHRMYLRMVKCQDGVGHWGGDQAAFNAATYVSLSIADFPHEMAVLSSQVGPIRHWHYAQSDMFEIWMGRQLQRHVYVNCAGRPISVLHQMDRRKERHAAWWKSFAKRFDGV